MSYPTHFAISRRMFCASGAASLAYPALAKVPRQRYAFAYFTNADYGRSGLRLAISDDGRHFVPVSGGAPLLIPSVGEHRLFRDPCIAHDPSTGLFHMVWTTSWFGQTIGHATSRNLMDWSEQRAIPVMAGYPGTGNTWALELLWDHRSRHFVVFWASTVAGAFPLTAGVDPKRDNHRIYFTTTADWRSFTPTQLLYDPGFSVIDATFLRRRDKLYLFVKDERDNPPHKNIRWCQASSPTGPFGPLSSPISSAWCEGPTAFEVDDEVLVLFDRYTEKSYGAVASGDMRTWNEVTSEISIPAGASHGTVFPIPRSHFVSLKRGK